jgi:nicotinamidase/pyrazinamidase
MKALIIIDVQNDFCPGGALAVQGGDEVVPVINAIIWKFNRVVATQDWHPGNQISFASNHPGKKPFDEIDLNRYRQTLWPDHCVQGSPGADFHPDLNTVLVDLIVRKGTASDVDSYSAFLENDRKTKTGLDGYLSSIGAKELFICGLATDYCVYYSAMDALKFGFTTSVIIDACRGIDMPAGTVTKLVNEMRNAGIQIVESGAL